MSVANLAMVIWYNCQVDDVFFKKKKTTKEEDGKAGSDYTLFIPWVWAEYSVKKKTELFRSGGHILAEADKKLSHDPVDTNWDYWRGIRLVLVLVLVLYVFTDYRGLAPTRLPFPPSQSVGRHQMGRKIQSNFRAVFLHSPAVSQEGGHRAGDREGLETEEKQEVLFKFQPRNTI